MTSTAISEDKLQKEWQAPTLLIRASSSLMLGLTIGHMSAYPWTSVRVRQDTQLATLMKSVPFEFMGERSTYWDLYFGWGILVAVLLLALAGILWVLPDFGRSAPRSAGTISAIIAATSCFGAFLSYRYFFLPPAVLFSLICVALLGATTKLLKRR